MKGQYYDDEMGGTDMMFCPPQQYDECPDNPDLLLLRNAAIDERKAIAQYLSAAMKTCHEELFIDVAEDEMQHFTQTMRLISALDPVQAKMFEEQNLDMLVMNRPAEKCNLKAWVKLQKEQKCEEVNAEPPSKHDMCAITLLTKALTGELHAINTYQQYMNCAQSGDVGELFCELMNDEKEHVARFTAALFDLTKEPPMKEKAD